MVDSLASTLRARIDTRPPGHSVFALIDMAGLSHLDQAPRIHSEIRKAGAVSVLRDERPDALLATPWLLSLPEDVSSRLEARTCEWALRGPAVTWLVSNLPLNSLADRLRRRAEAELPDTHPVLLRHFDPRVLPELTQVLNQTQRHAFLALGHEWLYLDRNHALQGVALTHAGDVDAFDAPLLLNDQQFATLLAASEIDQVMPELARAAPIEFMQLTAKQRVKLTRQCLSLAASWHLDGLADKVMVGVLTLKLGEGFHQRPEWAPWVAEMAQQHMGLLQVIENATVETQT
ncbi:MAG: DUF4123 domain-containing protein [Aquabacterium sp.]|jgi:hypothetical protein|nr:DUF4123 domain-containing protein [Aquabacterium sp.]